MSKQNNTSHAEKAKVAVVTGGSSGIGKATALTLYEEGYTVYAAARNVANMKDLKEQGMHPMKLDVTDEKESKAFIEHIIEQEKKLMF